MDAIDVDNKKTEESEQITGYGWFKIRLRDYKVFNSVKFLFSLLCGYFIANSTVINGLYSTSISTIERRFLLSRFVEVSSLYNVACVCLHTFFLLRM